jgi:hypothetical protein
MSEPAFSLNENVEYRWAAAGEFVGEARVIEVLPDGRYRLERIDGAPFPREAGIFAEEQLRLRPAPVGSG